MPNQGLSITSGSKWLFTGPEQLFIVGGTSRHLNNFEAGA
jgi:hypothetical protein